MTISFWPLMVFARSSQTDVSARRYSTQRPYAPDRPITCAAIRAAGVGGDGRLEQAEAAPAVSEGNHPSRRSPPVRRRPTSNVGGAQHGN